MSYSKEQQDLLSEKLLNHKESTLPTLIEQMMEGNSKIKKPVVTEKVRYSGASVNGYVNGLEIK
jgi:hypothetical protein